MTIYIFQCSDNSKMHGYTRSQNGANLPKGKPCSGTWKLFKEIEVSRTSPALVAVDKNAMLDGIEENGYYIGTYEIDISVREGDAEI